MKIIGIYKIENKVNGKIYVGSSVNVQKRWKHHKYNLKVNTHQNSHLQSSWNKHGEESFEHSLLQECLPEEIKYWEEYYIELYESYKQEKGYNVERISQGQKIVSEETKEILSKLNSGENNYFYEKHFIGEDNPMYGKHHSDKSKELMGKKKKGKMLGKDNPNYEKGLYGEDNPMYGKHHSGESKELMSKNRIGKTAGENHPRAILSKEKVREIRQKYVPCVYTIKMLAQEYGVKEVTIAKILQNKTWKEDNISKGKNFK